MALHFVEDYERLVSKLLKKHSLDQAMSLAVGGDYDGVGQIEVDVLRYAGLSKGNALVDIGCGSGRLSSALSRSGLEISYLGTDIVQKLLDYAKKKSDKSYKFKLHRDLSIPVADTSVDMICAFSVFTHLYHHETYLYLADAHRALRAGRKLVFSFLELAEPDHWGIFENTATSRRNGSLDHLNAFIERPAIKLWAKKLGFELQEFIDSGFALEGSKALGQSAAILVKN